MRPTGSGRRVEAHRRRRSCLARGFRGGVSPRSDIIFGVPELGVARHLSILTLCALLFFRFASLPFYASRAEVATRQPPSRARRPCACLPRTISWPGARAGSQQRTIGRRPRCDASSEPEIRAQTIINAPTRGVGDGASDGGRSSPATGQWFAGPPSASHPGKRWEFCESVCVCVCLPRRERKKRGARFGTNDAGGTG